MLYWFSPEAETDLYEIALTIAERNPERALSFVDELRERCVSLSGYPNIGRLRDPASRPSIFPSWQLSDFLHDIGREHQDRTHHSQCMRPARGV
jgi:plasmid stabilization system protein ParE